jgi:hypothetical protein
MNIITKKTSAGHYTVTITVGGQEKGTFNLTDMQILSDIDEMNNNGFENQLSYFETFEDVKKYCLNKIS